MSETQESQIDTDNGAYAPMPEDLAAAMDCFFGARRSLSLYNEDHPIAVRSFSNTAAAFHDALARHGRLVFTATDQGLMVNDRLYAQNADSRTFRRRMLQRGIQTLSILPSFDASELPPLLRLMEMPPAKVREQGGPTRILDSMGVEAVSIVEIAFADKRPEDETQVSPLEAFEADPELECLAAFLLGEEERISDDLYAVLLEVLHDSSRTASLLILCANRASPEALQNGKVSLIAQVVRRIENIVSQRCLPDWDDVVPVIRQAIAKLPPAVRPRVFSIEAPAAQERAEERRVSPETIDEILAELAQTLSEAMQVPTSLKGTVATPAEVGAVVAPSRAEGAETKKSRLSVLLDGLAAMRIPAAPAVEEFPWLRRQPHQTTSDLAMVLLDVLEKQEDPEQYSALATKLEHLFGVLVSNGSLHDALKLARRLAHHSDDQLPGPPWRRLRARASLQSIGIPALLQLGRRAFSQDPDMAEDAAELLLALGEEGILTMVTALAEGLPELSVHVISERVARVGEDAVPYLRRVLQTASSHSSVPLLNVLARVGTENATRALAQGLSSHDFMLRLNVLNCLGRAPAEVALPLVLPALQDKHPAVRRAAIAALGQMHTPACVPYLRRIALSFPFGREKRAMVHEAIAALGRVEEDEAVAALDDVMKKKYWLGGNGARQLKLSAIESLKPIGSPAAIETLQAHAQSPDPTVREACQQALAEVQRPVQGRGSAEMRVRA
jgi:HEAT repeat protein